VLLFHSNISLKPSLSVIGKNLLDKKLQLAMGEHVGKKIV
jgi:hypothetical protein